MTDHPRPIPESYWVEPGRLLVGGYPGHPDLQRTRQRLDAFLEAGFDVFIDLTAPGDREPYLPALAEEARLYKKEIAQRNFPIADFSLPSAEAMTAILDAIDQALAAGRKVYLHCVGGIGRTGTAVGCYLVRRGLSGAQALSRLDELYQTASQSALYPKSPETEAQAQFVLDWMETSPPARLP